MNRFYIKVLIISVFCLFMNGCKAKSNTTKKAKTERKETTEDIRDEQMEDYEEQMRQQRFNN